MLQFAKENDVLMAAAAGNERTFLYFPASDKRVASAGGIDAAQNFWDESPGGIGTCPYVLAEGGIDRSQCGSNWSLDPNGPKQEVVLPSRGIRNAVYRGKNWNPVIQCGDSYPGGESSTDGIGICTGTSMSTPMLSAIFGVLRSINPLIPAGDPETSVDYGIRDVVASATPQQAANLGWDQKLGYGVPQAGAAATQVIGIVRSQVAKNRVTPLFAVYSAGANDYAAVATPQAANALIRYQAANYASTGSFLQGEVVPGYADFPLLGNGEPASPARARALILATEFSRQVSDPPIVPLFLLDRQRPWPLGCTAQSPSCNLVNRDFVVASSVADLETAVNSGFELKGRQGYLYSTCSPEPICMPSGTQKLFQKCNEAIDDCAVFLEKDRVHFEDAGYVDTPGFATSTVLGYAYPSMDSDSDGLADGMEYVIGTRPFFADSDGDGVSDGVEYPQAQVPMSDPCAGPVITCSILDPSVFFNGFEQ